MEYPKINTLYKREGCGPYDEEKKRYQCDLQRVARKSKIIEGQYSREEFQSITRWEVTEKIDGTNIRISWSSANARVVKFDGRTDNSQIPAKLYAKLVELFPWEKMESQFHESQSVVLYGEGYGGNIQKNAYGQDSIDFILFDALIDGWWLEGNSVRQIAHALECRVVIPVVSDLTWEHMTTDEIVAWVKEKPESMHRPCHIIEGVVARAYPQMLFRNEKTPIMFKLKCKDFE